MLKDIIHLSKHSILFSLGNIASQIANLAFLPFLTKKLGASGYGEISLLMLIVFAASGIASLGINAGLGVIFFDRKNAENGNSVIWTSIFILSVSAGFLVAIGSYFSEFISVQLLHSPEFSLHVRYFLLASFFQIISVPAMLYMQYKNLSLRYSSILFFNAMAGILLMVFFIFVLNKGTLGYSQAYCFSQIFTAFIVLLNLLCEKQIPVFDKILAGKILKVGLPMMPGFVFLFLIQHVNKYYPSAFCSMESVGIYVFGVTLGSLMLVPVSSFQTAWFSYFMPFSDRKEEAARIFPRILRCYLLAVALLCLGIFYFIPAVLKVFFVKDFASAAPIAGIIAVSNLLLGVFSIRLAGIYFAGKIYFVTIIQFLTALISIATGFFFTQQWGIHGTAVSLLLSYLSMLLMVDLLSRYKKYFLPALGIRESVLFPLVCAAAILPSFFLPQGISASIAYSFTCIVFFSILIAFVLISKNELLFLRDILINTGLMNFSVFRKRTVKSDLEI